ncbi:MAG TPA: ArsR family transcriptional regulator [Solirubrobacterales bacterium]|jgi:DNA-binding transcriptional ArsR family regulator|nr:ArsR family transcriptional regulator [Solirubrobacterales bacterium]
MIDRRLIRLASDPVRLNALILLNERSAGAGEIAAELDVDPSVAGRHLDAMHDGGLIEVVGEVLNRGAVEPRYRAVVRALWEDEEWEALGREEQQRLTAWIMKMIESDARAAIEQGTFTSRKDSHISRTVSLVDEQGWRELTRIKQEALEQMLAAQAASTERLAETGEESIPVLSALLCCELPRGKLAG